MAAAPPPIVAVGSPAGAPSAECPIFLAANSEVVVRCVVYIHAFPTTSRTQEAVKEREYLTNGDIIVLFSISPQLFCYLLRVYNSVFMRL